MLLVFEEEVEGDEEGEGEEFEEVHGWSVLRLGWVSLRWVQGGGRGVTVMRVGGVGFDVFLWY